MHMLIPGGGAGGGATVALVLAAVAVVVVVGAATLWWAMRVTRREVERGRRLWQRSALRLRAATSPWDPRAEISRMRLDLDENLRQTERLLGDRGVAAALPAALIELLPRLRSVAAELDRQLVLWEGEPDAGLVRSALPQLSRRVRGVVSDALRMRSSALQLIDEASRGTREAAEADVRHGLQALDDALASIRQLHVPPAAGSGAAAAPPPPPP